MRVWFRIIFLVIALPSFCWADGLPQGDFRLDASKSDMSYLVIHKFHQVIGRTRSIEGRIMTKGSEGNVMIRIDAASFDSGNGNRDAHMKEVIETHKFPYVVFKGKISAASGDRAHVEGILNFHGVEKPLGVDIPFELKNGALIAHVQFSTKLSEHQVERPSLLFVKVEDDMKITGDLLFKTAPEPLQR